jgi:hypothetical protein
MRGFADQRLRNLKNALDPSNRRISIIVQHISSNTDEAESPGRDTKEKGRREQRREVKKEAGLGGQPGKLLRDVKSLRHIT